jgi:hypothetical protein
MMLYGEIMLQKFSARTCVHTFKYAHVCTYENMYTCLRRTKETHLIDFSVCSEVLNVIHLKMVSHLFLHAQAQTCISRQCAYSTIPRFGFLHVAQFLMFASPGNARFAEITCFPYVCMHVCIFLQAPKYDVLREIFGPQCMISPHLWCAYQN